MNEHLDLAITLASRDHGYSWPAYLIGGLWFVFMAVVIGRKAVQARRRQKAQQDAQAPSSAENDWNKPGAGGS